MSHHNIRYQQLSLSSPQPPIVNHVQDSEPIARTLVEHALQEGQQVGVAPLSHHQLRLPYLLQHRELVLAVEGVAIEQQPVQQNAQRPDVRPLRVVGPLLQDLRRHVEDSAAELFGLLVLAFAQVDAQAEVDEFDIAQVLRDNDVIELNVPMRNGKAMEEHKAVGDSSKYPLDLLLAEPPRLAELVESVGEVLQDKIAIPIEDEVIIVGHDILMLDGLVKLVLLFLLQALCYYLYRHQSVRQDILGFVDLS